MKSSRSADICIVGAGMVGLSVAHQILEKFSGLSIVIIDKEIDVGEHSSGRNSGVLHSGLYYEPKTLKAKLCVLGAKRLKEWCYRNSLSVINCGKVVTPQKPELDSQLEILLGRGRSNGAKVEIIDEQQFNELVPDGRTSTGRAIWSESTCIVKPIEVVKKLKQELKKKGVNFLFFEKNWEVKVDQKTIIFNDSSKLSYDHLINCAGLQADKVAQKFNVGNSYTMLPFKGSYWKLKCNAPFKFTTNLYPVPDLKIPFLGVHITPSIDKTIYLGPTAFPAMGREQYKGLKGFDPLLTLNFTRHMATQIFKDKKMRNYIFNQAFDWRPNNFLKSLQLIAPKIEMEHIEKSNKVGIRPQLYDLNKKELVQDFVMLDGQDSSHVINAISPAFTASFELADYIVDNSSYFN
ncbi:MAG: FAD-dependent oxidoreductase [Methylophilaceae bacterium]|nr:FAD-dependent oxidoreductase [Methylophilaceae bacterium]